MKGFKLNRLDTKNLLSSVFTPTIVLSLSYLILGQFCKIPHILLFCILGTVILVPIELGVILIESKKENAASPIEDVKSI